MCSSEMQSDHAEIRAGRISTADVPRERLVEFCTRWGITQFGVVGSDCDIDILVSIEPSRDYSLYDMVEIQWELEEMYGRQLVVAERETIEFGENEFRKKLVFESLDIIYVSS